MARTFNRTRTLTMSVAELAQKAREYDAAAQTARVSALAADKMGDSERAHAETIRWCNAAHYARKMNERARELATRNGNPAELEMVNANIGRAVL